MPFAPSFSSCKVARVQYSAIEYNFAADKYGWIGGWRQKAVLEAIAKFYLSRGVLAPGGSKWRYTHSAMRKPYTPIL